IIRQRRGAFFGPRLLGRLPLSLWDPSSSEAATCRSGTIRVSLSSRRIQISPTKTVLLELEMLRVVGLALGLRLLFFPLARVLVLAAVGCMAGITPRKYRDSTAGGKSPNLVGVVRERDRREEETWVSSFCLSLLAAANKGRSQPSLPPPLAQRAKRRWRCRRIAAATRRAKAKAAAAAARASNGSSRGEQQRWLRLQRAAHAGVSAEGEDSVAEAERSVIESLSRHVRAVVATLGRQHGIARRADKWQHLYAGFTIWLSQMEAVDEASAKEEARKHIEYGRVGYSNADVGRRVFT
ncbi:hypothetical protein Taro_035523, partial [Colocasia esculenta]|nr:hypothetical protein [Colocasia esculenta]